MTTTAPTGLADFESLWDYSDPAQTEQRFRELLPAAQACGDRSYHLQLLTQIARAQGLQRQYDQAHATLDHVRQLIGTALPTVTVRYQLERGRVFNDTANPAAAKDCFTQAWELAQSHRLDGFAIDAAHMLAILETGEAALAWNERAMQYATASSDPAARKWLGTLQNNIGWAYYAMGRHQDALEVFQKALAFRQQQGKAAPIRIARYAVAKAQRALGRLQEALETQTALLGECQRANQPDGYIHEEVAECLLALKRPAEATEHFAAAYNLLSKDPWFPSEESARLQRLSQLEGKK